jgi:glycosyltransferase involved in cell wall biosynthesis
MSDDRQSIPASLLVPFRLPEASDGRLEIPGVVSVLIPALNEEATIEGVIRRVAALPLSTEIIVVDDGSTDATPEILRRLEQERTLDVHVITHEHPRGKGAAVREAIAAATGDFVLIQDADVEYDTDDIPRLLAPMVLYGADAVYGTRLRGGPPQRTHRFPNYVGNRLLTLIADLLFNTTISDLHVGYKAFRADLIRSLPLYEDGFEIDPEITAKLLLRGDVKLYEVAIAYHGRTHEEGKKITWRHAFTALAVLLRLRLQGRRALRPRASRAS